MKKKIAVSIFFIGILFSCCNAKSTNTNDKIIVTEVTEERDCSQISLSSEEILEIKEHIKYQTKIESEENKDVYKMTDRDTELCSQLIIKSLIQQGYKVPSDDDFSEKMKSIFKLDFNEINKSCNIVDHNKFFVYLISQGNDDDYLKETEYDYTYDHIFFIKYDNFITWVPYLGNVIREINNNQIEVCFEPTISHRNKYLFNNSKASLTWLINNDLEFLEILVREFGYGKEPKINKTILNKIYKDYRSIEPSDTQVLFNLFAKKDCHGNLQIREDLCRYISNGSDTSSDYKFVEMMYDFATLMIFETENIPNLEENERLKIATYLGYYIESYYTKYDDNISYKIEGAYDGSFFRNSLTLTEENDLLTHIKNNNYYNLPGLEGIVNSVLVQIEEESQEWLRTHPDSSHN